MFKSDYNVLGLILKLPLFRKEIEKKLKANGQDLQKEITSLQTLTENLRQRIQELEQERKQTERTISNLMKSRQLLDKTNNNLTDLCNYMEMGNAEAIREMTESMEWSSTLLRIIKNYLQVLGRKEELEQRLSIIGNKLEFDNPNLD